MCSLKKVGCKDEMGDLDYLKLFEESKEWKI